MEAAQPASAFRSVREKVALMQGVLRTLPVGGAGWGRVKDKVASGCFPSTLSAHILTLILPHITHTHTHKHAHRSATKSGTGAVRTPDPLCPPSSTHTRRSATRSGSCAMRM